MTEMYAQGDLLIERVNDVVPSGTMIPPDATGALVLAEGELTGHRHAIFERATMFRDDALAREVPAGLYVGHVKVEGGPATIRIRSTRRSRSAKAPIACAASASSSRRTRRLSRIEIAALSRSAARAAHRLRGAVGRACGARPRRPIMRRVARAGAQGLRRRRAACAGARSCGSRALPISQPPGPSGAMRPATMCARWSSTPCGARPSWPSTAPFPCPCAWLLASEPGLSRAAEFCASIDEARAARRRTNPAGLADAACRRLPAPPRRRLSFAASSFSLLSAPWLGTLQYLHDVVRPHTPAPRPSPGLWALARNASWIVPHEHVCWLMERPQLIRLDANGRLHAPDGPALRYGDGSKIYAWKGILLPARV